MMNKLIWIYLIGIFAFCERSNAQVLKKDHLVSKIGNIAETHGEFLSRNLKGFVDGNLRLDRFDMQLGVTASGDVGIMSFAGSSAAEFIWERNEIEESTDDIDEEEGVDQAEIEVGMESSDDIYQKLYSELNKFFKFQKFKKRHRKRIIRRLRADAEDISKVIRNLVLMPRVGNWYVGGFFQNYSLSKNFSLGIVSFGKSKRVRLRFKVNSIPMRRNELGDLTLGQKKLKAAMDIFNSISKRNYLYNQFRFKRVFAVHELGKELDFAVFKSSFTRGVQIEYKKANDEIPYVASGIIPKMYAPIRALNQKIIEHFDRKFYDDSSDQLSLKQIRLKYSLDKSVGIKLATVETSSTFEFHYKR